MVTAKILSKDAFFMKFGCYLKRVHRNNAEGGDFLLFHPEEEKRARKYADNGCQVVSVHMEPDKEGEIKEWVRLQEPFSEYSDKYGYFVLQA